MTHPLASRIRSSMAGNSVRVLTYGVDGIGKTTFGKEAPDPIFMCAENSLLPKGCLSIVPQSWPDAFEIIRQLIADPLGRKSFVLDTVDWLYPKAVHYVCSRDNAACKGRLILADGQPFLEGYGYGKGPSVVCQAWSVFLEALDRLRLTHNMNIILLGHAGRHRVRNPGGDDYDMIGPKLDRDTADLLCEWPDAVLYAEFYRQTLTEEDKASGKVKKITDGTRVCWTESRNAHRAKNRYSMPEAIRLQWSEFAKYALADLDGLHQQIEEKLAQIQDAQLSAAVHSYLENERRESGILLRVIDRLDERLKTGVAHG